MADRCSSRDLRQHARSHKSRGYVGTSNASVAHRGPPESNVLIPYLLYSSYCVGVDRHCEPIHREQRIGLSFALMPASIQQHLNVPCPECSSKNGRTKPQRLSKSLTPPGRTATTRTAGHDNRIGTDKSSCHPVKQAWIHFFGKPQTGVAGKHAVC